MPNSNVGIELLYLRKETTAPTTYLSPSSIFAKTSVFDMNLNYMLLGINKYVRKEGSPVEGFGEVTLGTGWTYLKNRDNGRESQATKFARGIRVGANIWISQNIALKFQAQLLSVV